MRSRRALWLVAIGVVLVGAAASVWWFLRGTLPPSITSLLPTSTQIAYANIGVVRTLTHFDQHWDVEHSPGYDDFVRATGIEAPRDLDEIALSVSGKATDHRYSEVMRGHFDRQKLEAWLKQHADGQAKDGAVTVYTIQHEGRPDRIAIIDDRTVIASNTADDAPMREMLQRFQSPSVPDLLRRNYAAVPTGSPVWWISAYENEAPALTIGDNHLGLGLPQGSTLVASLRYIRSLELRLQAITPSEADAQRTAENWSGVLHLTRGLNRATHSDDALAQAVSSAKVTQDGPNVAITAQVTREALEELAKLTQDPAKR
ncbi:MAG: hypothetical protein JOZ43_04720 [Acidobacteriales bacterium]|nr:hypothetical protein [Terriglobales bacterium]